jgi:hypothetical protein
LVSNTAIPFAVTDKGLRLTVRLTPRASRNRIEGVIAGPDREPALKVSVTAPPEAGKANAALIKLLAKEWRVAKSRIAITAGASARLKTLTFTGEPGELSERIKGWLEADRAQAKG